MQVSDRDVVVRVADREPREPGGMLPEPTTDVTGDGAESFRVPEQLAVVRGIADELDVRHGMDETVVTMRWKR